MIHQELLCVAGLSYGHTGFRPITEFEQDKRGPAVSQEIPGAPEDGKLETFNINLEHIDAGNSMFFQNIIQRSSRYVYALSVKLRPQRAHTKFFAGCSIKGNRSCRIANCTVDDGDCPSFVLGKVMKQVWQDVGRSFSSQNPSVLSDSFGSRQRKHAHIRANINECAARRQFVKDHGECVQFVHAVYGKVKCNRFPCIGDFVVETKAVLYLSVVLSQPSLHQEMCKPALARRARRNQTQAPHCEITHSYKVAAQRCARTGSNCR